jgi:hypothetical protein
MEHREPLTLYQLDRLCNMKIEDDCEAVIRPHSPEHVLFFDPKISVWTGFLNPRNVRLFNLLFLKAFGYFNDTKMIKQYL